MPPVTERKSITVAPPAINYNITKCIDTTGLLLSPAAIYTEFLREPLQGRSRSLPIAPTTAVPPPPSESRPATRLETLATALPVVPMEEAAVLVVVTLLERAVSSPKNGRKSCRHIGQSAHRLSHGDTH